jgi:hypothetical protein
MKKTDDAIKKLFDMVDESKESLLILHVDENDQFSSHVCGEHVEIAAGIATIVYDGLKADSDKNLEKLAKAIVDGVAHSMQIPSLSAIKVMLRLTKAMAQSREDIKEELAEKLGLTDNDDEDDDDDERENCEECENNRWCPLPDAVAYRKKNHIPAPKKRKNGKRGGKKNENAN